MNDDRNRRRFLQLTGTGAALSVAGCLDSFGGDDGADGDDGGDETPDINGTADSSQDDDGDDEAEDGGESDGTDQQARTLTAAVEPDQEEMAALQEDINQRVENENLTQQEAQQEYQQRQTDLIREAAESFESSVTDVDGVTIEDSVLDAGAFLLTGDPGAMVDLLNDEDGVVSALLPEATFQQVQQPGQGQG